MSALLIAAGIALAPQAGHADHDHSANAGRVSFPTSCGAAAQPDFVRGVAWLHSFEYAEAARSFAAAAAADPACGIAHWGVAMSNYHPLWAPPTPAELERGASAVAAARAAGARTRREQDYIGAIETFFADAGRVDHRTRALAYTAAMEALHRRYPEDREAAVFFALALIAAGAMEDDPAFGSEHRAAELLNAVLAAEPDHPGVAHYLIHSFDYPPLAHLALPAARRYAGIAPASAHAQHMPSHIFIRLGHWDEAIRSNLASEAAARQADERGLAGAQDQVLHAMDYLIYAYLQAGRDDEARQVLARLDRMRREEGSTPTLTYAATAIPARFALERRQWHEAAALTLPPAARAALPARFAWAEAHVLLARAVGAARSDDVDAARSAVASLAEIERALTVRPGEYDWRTQVSIARQIAAAWLAAAERRPDEALATMRAAAALDDATEKHPVTPGAILPAREQLGELLLALGRPAEALTEFEASLQRSPRRFVGVSGAAQAAAAAGDTERARRHYAALVELAGNGGARPEVEQARAWLAAGEVASRGD